MGKTTIVHQQFGWVSSACVGWIISLACFSAEALTLQPQTRDLKLPRNYRVAQEVMEGLQASSGKRVGSSVYFRLLDLETDFYDKSTGLYSEGVWHNCMAGIAALQLSRMDESHGHHNGDAARIADSLFQYSWDGKSFRRRAWSGNWGHSRLQRPDTDVHQANYYKESPEHRCIQHAIALVFWSMLAQDSSDGTDLNTIRSQQSLILKQFLDEFWNGRRWTTISVTQGSGTNLRASASSATPPIKSTTDDWSPGAPYFRAVDQAVAVLACLQALRLWDSTGTGNANRDERERIVHLIEMTCKDLLDERDGFGYNNLADAKTYLGLNRNLNFWHEGWVMLALVSAKDYIWPMDAQEGHLKVLWNGLMEQYTTVGQDLDSTGTIWHWPLSQKNIESNVRYCGDNALAYAIRRNFQGKSLDSKHVSNDDDSFWTFVKKLRSKKNDHHLASVADVYPQVRLHPNTELAALLVWPP